MCRCDGDAICVGYDPEPGALGGGTSAVEMLNSVGERTPSLDPLVKINVCSVNESSHSE